MRTTRAVGAQGLKSVPGEAGRQLPDQVCGTCGSRMETQGCHEKTFTCRLGRAAVKRKRVHCRICGTCFFPLDRHPGIAGGNVTPGAAGVIADILKDDSYGRTSKKLMNAAGISLSPASVCRWMKRMAEPLLRFEREAVVPGPPPSERCILSIDGTGVPVRKEETEGIAGKQSGGSSATREAKPAVIYTADQLNPKTGEPVKDPGSDVGSGLIDSAAADGGSSANTGFGQRVEREAARNGLFPAKELVVISDGAAWIRNVCADLFCGMAVTCILDFFHLSERLSDALKEIFPGPAERKAAFETHKAMLKGGRASEVVAVLRPCADRHEAVSQCLKHTEANIGRMNRKSCRERGIHIGSGVVESACRSLVGARLKRPGSRWSVAGANAVLALKSCVENNRWADFLEWNSRRSRMA